MILPDLVVDMAGIPETEDLVVFLLSTLDWGMTKQVEEGWRGGKRRIGSHTVVADTWSQMGRTSYSGE